MYTSQPLPDYSHTHIGLGITFTVVLLCLAGLYSLRSEWSRRALIGCTTALITLLVITYHGSFSTKAPRNEQVIAKFVGFTAESRDSKSGKYTTTHHYVYGTFQVPEGIVVIQVAPNQPIADKVILYKN